MRSRRALAIEIALAVVLLIGVGVVAWVLRPSPGKTITVATVLDNAQKAQGVTLARLGPNSTLHYTIKSHDDSSKSLPDSTLEVWMAFDDSGALSSSSSVTRGLDGRVYRTTDLVDGQERTTDALTGKIYPGIAVTKKLMAEALRANYENIFKTLSGGLDLNAPAQKSAVDGRATYTLGNVNVDAATYLLTRIRDVDRTTGAVSDTGFETFEVLDGQITPTPSPSS